MNDFYFPKEIENLISAKPYSVDSIGMSDSLVLIFDDMVLKIQSVSRCSENEHIMMDWLKNKVSVPECVFDITENGKNYLLMSKIKGKMSCEDEFMKNPRLLISTLRMQLMVFGKLIFRNVRSIIV